VGAEARREAEQPSFTRDRVFVGSNTNLLFALDNANGRLAWRWKTGGDVIGTSGDAKGGAYYASLDNVLRAVNRGNGNQRWIKEIPTRPLLPPQTFGDGMMYEEIVVLTASRPRSTRSPRRPARRSGCTCRRRTCRAHR